LGENDDTKTTTLSWPGRGALAMQAGRGVTVNKYSGRLGSRVERQRHRIVLGEGTLRGHNGKLGVENRKKKHQNTNNKKDQKNNPIYPSTPPDFLVTGTPTGAPAGGVNRWGGGGWVVVGGGGGWW